MFFAAADNPMTMLLENPDLITSANPTLGGFQGRRRTAARAATPPPAAKRRRTIKSFLDSDDEDYEASE